MKHDHFWTVVATAVIIIGMFVLGGVEGSPPLEIESIVKVDLAWYEAYVAKVEEAARVEEAAQTAQIAYELSILRYVFPIHPDDFLWDKVKGDLTSPYGERDPEEIGGLGDGFHEGLDLWGKSEVGTWQGRVVAAAGGIILNHWFNHPVKGKYIEILHDDGSITEYAHLSKSLVHERRKLEDGSVIPWRVEQGEIIGRVGNTGLSKGVLEYKTHLHFALRIPDSETGVLRYVNPLKYILIPEE